MQFINGKQALIYDTFIEKNIIMEIKEGDPFYNNCKLNDCAHVGFTICLQQLYNCDGERNRCEIQIKKV